VVALAIVAIILLALTLDFVVEMIRLRQPASVSLFATAVGQSPAWQSLRVPLGFLVDPAHVWMRRESQGLVRVGGDGFATALLGKPDSVKLLAEAGTVVRGQPLAEISRRGRALTLRSPVSGTLVGVNAALTSEDASADPFGKGWFVTVRPDRPAPVESMHTAGGAQAFMAAEWERVRAFVLGLANASAPVGMTMADGGPLQPGFLLQLPEADHLSLEKALFGIEPMAPTPEEQDTQGARR